MSKVDEYRRLAAECDQIARAVSPVTAKEVCHAMAKTYRRLAEKAARDGGPHPED